LRSARDTFDAPGAVQGRACASRAAGSWGDQPQAGTRGMGQALTSGAPDRHKAAESLSNREIGRKLYLSHRTVGSHLYRTFPKLGITSRVQLASALARG